jgi:hypothetical protein
MTRREEMVNGMEVVPQEQKPEHPVGFDHGGAFARPLAPAVLGEAAHHAKDKAAIAELDEIRPNRHFEYLRHEQQHQGRADAMAKPNAGVCHVAGDHPAGFVDEEARHLQQRTDEEPSREGLVDREQPPPDVAMFFPGFFLDIVGFWILPRIGDIAVAMVLRVLPPIDFERTPYTDRRPDERPTHRLRNPPHAVNRFVLQGGMPLHDVARQRSRDPPRDVFMRSEQQ